MNLNYKYNINSYDVIGLDSKAKAKYEEKFFDVSYLEQILDLFDMYYKLNIVQDYKK